MKKRVILCFVGHYLPGYRSGGPIRSISNLVENLGDEFKIHIICSDRDLSDKEPYANINTNTWKTVEKHRWLKLFRLPVIRIFADWGYIFFAKHRHSISRLLMPNTQCNNGQCAIKSTGKK